MNLFTEKTDVDALRAERIEEAAFEYELQFLAGRFIAELADALRLAIREQFSDDPESAYFHFHEILNEAWRQASYAVDDGDNDETLIDWVRNKARDRAKDIENFPSLDDEGAA